MHKMYCVLVGICLFKEVLSDGIATIQLGSTSHLIPPISTTPVFAGKAMLIVAPTPAAGDYEVPPGGIDCFISSDLAVALRDTKKTSCSSPDTACQKALQETVQNKSVDLQTRGIELLSWIIAIGSVITYIYMHIDIAVNPPEYLHYEPQVLSEVLAAVTASTVAVGIDNAPPFITVTQTQPSKPSPTPAQDPTLNIDVNGDIKIQMSQDLANNLQDTIVHGSTCPIEHPGSIKRTPDSNCLSAAGINVIINAAPQMRLADLVLIAAPHAPALRQIAAGAARALTTIVLFARESASILQMSPDNAEILGRVVFALVYDAIALGAQMSSQIILEAAKWTIDEPISSACLTTATATVGEVTCSMLNAVRFCQSDYDETSGCSITDMLMTTWAFVPHYNQPPITTAAPQKPPVCFNYADPHAGVSYCQCNDGQNYVLPSGGVCASYTGIPPSQSLVPTSTQAPPPPVSPVPATRSLILVFWYLPPVTGPVTYRLFEVAADSKRDFDQECDHQVADGQFGYLNDPKQDRVDDFRSKGTEPTRQAPGILPPGTNDQMISHGVPALYKENIIGTAGIDWPNLLKHVDCQPPTSDQQHTFTSRMGSTCGDSPVPHVMNLVMVCPVNF